MFYACRQAPEPCCRAFLALLLTRLTDAHQPPITRSACAAYVASFLARYGLGISQVSCVELVTVCGQGRPRQ